MLNIVCSYPGSFQAAKRGIKTCSRRRWNDSHAAKFHKGGLVHLLEHSYRVQRYKGIPERLTVRLTCDPYREFLGHMPLEDLRAEGNLWPDKETFIKECFDGRYETVWVVRWDRAGDAD